MLKIILIVVALGISCLAYAQNYSGTIIKVTDGDTFVFQTEEGSLKIRMEGIDAPEKNQPYGQQSKIFLEKYLYKNGMVKKTGVDKYGRTLGTLFIDGVDINKKSIEEGWSWHYKKYNKDQELAKAEITARNNKKGLWQDNNPVEPWIWRKMK